MTCFSEPHLTCIPQLTCLCVCFASTVNDGTLLPSQRRLNFALALLSALIGLPRFASSLYAIFPKEPLKDEGRSLENIVEKTVVVLL